jgi:hypothetical protein
MSAEQKEKERICLQNMAAQGYAGLGWLLTAMKAAR